MKKIGIIALLLVLCMAMCLALFGCGDKENTPDNPPASDGANNTPPTGDDQGDTGNQGGEQGGTGNQGDEQGGTGNQGGEQGGTGNQGGEKPEMQKDPTEGLEYTLNEDGESYSVTGIGTATDTDIVIAATYEGKPVTSIGGEAFSGCSKLIQIEGGVQYVDKWAIGHTGVTSVTLRANTVGIGYGAFSGCSSLTSIKYSGTKAQWKAISKGNGWNWSTGNYTVTCSDGTLTKSES